MLDFKVFNFYSWKADIKTEIYYLRRKALHQADQFTIEPKKQRFPEDEEEKKLLNVYRLNNYLLLDILF